MNIILWYCRECHLKHNDCPVICPNNKKIMCGFVASTIAFHRCFLHVFSYLYYSYGRNLDNACFILLNVIVSFGSMSNTISKYFMAVLCFPKCPNDNPFHLNAVILLVRSLIICQDNLLIFHIRGYEMKKIPLFSNANV